MTAFVVTVLICGHGCGEHTFRVVAPPNYCEHAVIFDLARIVKASDERIARWTCEPA